MSKGLWCIKNTFMSFWLGLIKDDRRSALLYIKECENSTDKTNYDID